MYTSSISLLVCVSFAAYLAIGGSSFKGELLFGAASPERKPERDSQQRSRSDGAIDMYSPPLKLPFVTAIETPSR
jgi:hypothetical protein